MADDNATNRYPKHVWSPAGGWYTQPKNWKANTAVVMGVMLGLTAMMWSVSAEREHRYKMPEVRIERIEPIRGLKWSRKNCADTFRNSPAGSHLRDTGRSRSLSTRRHRRRRPAARAPHRKIRGTKDSLCGNTAFMGYSVQSGCKDICKYAQKRIDKFHQCCTFVSSPCLLHLVCNSEVDL
jgi:hypothetical protein